MVSQDSFLFHDTVRANIAYGKQDATDEEIAIAQLEDPGKEVLQQREQMLSKRHNAAVEEMEIVAAEFNNEVRAYKAQAE